MSITARTIPRLRLERRHEERREAGEEPLLSALLAFATTERRTFRHLDRRRTIRREGDLRRRLGEG